MALDGFATAYIPLGPSIGGVVAFRSLRAVLALRSASLGPASVGALSRAPWFCALESLNLTDNPVGGAGMEQLLEAWTAGAALTTLNLSHCKPGETD